MRVKDEKYFQLYKYSVKEDIFGERIEFFKFYSLETEYEVVV